MCRRKNGKKTCISAPHANLHMGQNNYELPISRRITSSFFLASTDMNKIFHIIIAGSANNFLLWSSSFQNQSLEHVLMPPPFPQFLYTYRHPDISQEHGSPSDIFSVAIIPFDGDFEFMWMIYGWRRSFVL